MVFFSPYDGHHGSVFDNEKQRHFRSHFRSHLSSIHQKSTITIVGTYIKARLAIDTTSIIFTHAINADDAPKEKGKDDLHNVVWLDSKSTVFTLTVLRGKKEECENMEYSRE